jgi:hypothetical protein
MSAHDPGASPPGGPAAPDTPDDPAPELPWYVGHPVIKVPVFALLGIGLVATQVEETRWSMVTGCASLFVISLGIVASSVLLLRGTIPPLPRPFVRSSPVTTIVCGIGFAVGSAAIGLDTLIGPDEKAGVATAGAGLSVALVVVGLAIEFLVRIGALPDSWKVPEDRTPTPPREAPAASGDGGDREGDA